MEAPRRPRRAHEIDHVAVLEQDGRAERIAQCAQARPHPTDAQRPRQGEHPDEGHDRVRNDVEPVGPGERHEGINDLPRVEDRRHRVSQEGDPAILPRVPERPAPSLPLLLHPEIEWIVKVDRVAKGELLAPEQDHPIAVEQQGDSAKQAEHGQEGTTHQDRDPSIRSDPRVQERLVDAAVHGSL